MAAYAALLSLSQTSDMDQNHGNHLFSLDMKEKLRSIHEYVLFMLSFFEDFPKKANRWEGKIRDIAYQTEDIIELFMWQKMQISYGGLNNLSELEGLVEKIGTLAGEMMEDRPAAVSSSSTPDAVSSSVSSSTTPAAVSSSSTPDAVSSSVSSSTTPAAVSSSSSSRIAHTSSDVVIGLDEDVMAIKERVCGPSSKLQVVPIVGMGGIGKTTLARTVYNDPLMIRHFDIRVWLTVSQDYSPKRLRKILLGLADSMKLLEVQMPLDEIDDYDIALKVYKHLKGRRYLIVMDDVWGTDVWDNVRNIFPDDCNGSRIVLTSRVLDVAAYPDPDSHLHQMQFMTTSQSWDLLKRKVFTNNVCPPRLEKVGEEIARKCLGLPLSIVLVAGFLSTAKQSVASWEEILETANTLVGQESYKILSLSYSHLPNHLRPCFLFMGGFPEDTKIRASTLVKLWVAEGFLKHEIGCSKSLEEEAEEYLENLVKRNLVIVNRRKTDGKIKRCSLHDMVRDLCIRKAEEERFLYVLPQDSIDGLGWRSLYVLPQDSINGPRHLSLYGSHMYDICGLNIRTILGFQLKNFPSSPSFLGPFILLRVLDVIDIYTELPSQLFELFHLRYLAFICSLEIPSAISNLVNLQTLIVRPTFKYKRSFKYASYLCLPSKIWSMLQLRHLVLYNLHMLPHPLYESNLPLQNLQTLSLVENLVWNERVVEMIPNVKRLGLVYRSNEEFDLHHLWYLLQLEKLEVNGCNSFSWREQNPNFPDTLKKLTLVGGGFPWEDMEIVGLLPNLQVLKLLDYACHGETWETADEEFLQLEFLLIDTSHLQKWVTQSSHFPRLKSLVLHGCPSLCEIPEGIGEIPTLELIEIDDESLMESAMKIKEDQENYGNYALQVRSVQFG